jgi:isoquinoline 1-oxidoreductase subunit alpha
MKGDEKVVRLKVNGVDRSFNGDPEMPLLWYLRDELNLTGAKFGCGIALCGACTVHKNGDAIRSCVTAMGDMAGADITTIEGLEQNGLHPVQKAWIQINVPQCGYCQPGQIMQAVAFLNSTKNPTDQQIDDAMGGNLCRCGTYQRIRAAIKKAAANIKG